MIGSSWIRNLGFYCLGDEATGNGGHTDNTICWPDGEACEDRKLGQICFVMFMIVIATENKKSDEIEQMRKGSPPVQTLWDALTEATCVTIHCIIVTLAVCFLCRQRLKQTRGQRPYPIKRRLRRCRKNTARKIRGG